MFRTLFTMLVALLPLPALADNLLGTIEGRNGARFELFSAKKVCVGPAFDALWIPADKEPVPGCWRFRDDDSIQIVFLDGDALLLPTAAIKRPTVL